MYSHVRVLQSNYQEGKINMKNEIMAAIDGKKDYIMTMDAITGTKREFTQEETESLLKIYEDNGERAFGFSDKELVKMVLVMDTAAGDGPDSSTMKDLLGGADLEGLCALTALCGDRGRRPELALKVKDAALSDGVNDKLALAMARAALDVLAAQNDITPYREDINALAAFLKQAGEDAFADASRFLVRVMERARQ